MPVTPFEHQPGDNGLLGDVEEKVMPFKHQPGDNGPKSEMVDHCPRTNGSQGCPYRAIKYAISTTEDPFGPHILPGCGITSF